MASRVALACALLAASSSGCFILFHDPEGSGGATSTGSSSGVTTASPGVAVSSSGSGSCNSPDLTTDKANCGSCNHACEGDCAHGVCQAVLVGSFPASVALLAANETHVFVATLSSTMPGGGTLYRVRADVAPRPGPVIADQTEVTDALGALAAGAGGLAYYAPQGVMTPKLLLCSGVAFSCTPTAEAPPVTAGDQHFSGLYFDGSNVFAALPMASTILRLDGATGHWLTELHLKQPQAHAIDGNGTILGWSTYQPPCAGTATIAEATNSTPEDLMCQFPLATNNPNAPVATTTAITSDGTLYTVLEDKNSTRAIYANDKLTFTNYSSFRPYGLDAHGNNVFVGTGAGLLRCDSNPNDTMGNTCVEIAKQTAEHIAVTNQYVWFADDVGTLYRATR